MTFELYFADGLFILFLRREGDAVRERVWICDIKPDLSLMSPADVCIMVKDGWVDNLSNKGANLILHPSVEELFK